MGAYSEFQSIPGLVATATLAAKQYYVVQLSSTAGECKVGTSATSKVIGVVQNDPAAGEAANVACLGIAKVASEDSVAIGDLLMCSTTGRAKTAATANTRIFGYALEAGDAADVIRCVLTGGSNL